MLDFKDKRVLVIGGAGFVGSNLVKKILDCSPKEIIVIDNLLSAERINVPDRKNITFICGSITWDSVLECLEDNIDYIFHLATFHGNQSSIHDPIKDHENNTYTTLKLCEKIKDFKNIKKVVYSSAGCTVAEKTYNKAEATTEDAPVSLYLDSPYQMSKIIGELYFNYYFKQYNVPVVKARFQNVYGPGEILGAGRWRGTSATVWRNVTPTFIYRAIKEMPLTVENEGIATRDFIYVDDIVNGLMLCATKGELGEVYNIASGEETSIMQLANLINKMAENPTPVKKLPKRTWDRSGKRFGSTQKAKDELGFTTKIPLEEGIKKTIAWTKESIKVIDNCITKHKEKMSGN